MSTAAAVQAITPKRPKRWQADLALAGVALVWGSTFIVVKQALSDISTIYFLALRFWLASAIMLAIFAASVSPRRFAGRAHGSARWHDSRAFPLAWLHSSDVRAEVHVRRQLRLSHGPLYCAGTAAQCGVVSAVAAPTGVSWRLGGTCGLGLMTYPSLDVHHQMNHGDVLTMGCAVAFACHLLILGHYSQHGLFEAVALGQILCTAALSTVSLTD